ncbi:DUF1648 domain-containing protein [Myroides sp. DW712]|uniref:DUF1648 domain-containing protein n=1 Tax=Myroides sp. DW712 TaxID=3389800 RepID=UPI00397AFE31
MKTQYPILKIKPSQLERYHDVINVILLLSLIGTTCYYYGQLPDTIPTHFNIAGEPDAYGDKITLLFLPGLGVFVFALLYYFQYKPHLFKHRITITAENIEEQYTKAIRMMRVLNTFTILLFFYIQYQTIQTALGKEEGLGQYFIVFAVIGGLLPLLTFVFSSKKTS